MGATPAGQMRSPIVFERETPRRSELGGPAPGEWSRLFVSPGKVRWGSGAERASAALGEQAVQTATFRVRSNTSTRGVTVKDRIVFAGLNWDIAAIAEFDFVPAEIEFTALASRD